MPKGKQHPGEFKQEIVERMRKEGMSFRETARRFGINDRQVRNWERIYLEGGAEALYEERRGKARGGKNGRPPKLNKQVEDDLIAENQRLRAEVDYLKKLNALVQKREQQKKKPK